MIVVIFVSARAHMRYLRCSLVIYVLGGQFHDVTASAACTPLKTTFYHYPTTLQFPAMASCI